jgi:hypothetical protein
MFGLGLIQPLNVTKVGIDQIAVKGGVKVDHYGSVIVATISRYLTIIKSSATMNNLEGHSSPKDRLNLSTVN